MRSIEDIKKEVQTSLEESLNFWESDTVATPDFREAKINGCKRGLENLDEMVQQKIAHEAIDLIDMTGQGLLDTERVKSVNRLFINSEDEEYKFLKSNAFYLSHNVVIKDKFLEMISSRYGFEIPSLQETGVLKNQINNMRKEMEKYRYTKATVEQYQKYLELEQLEAKLYSNEIAYGEYEQDKLTQEYARKQYAETLDNTKKMIEKLKSENSELTDSMHK